MGLPALEGPVANTADVGPVGWMACVAWARGRTTVRVLTPPEVEKDRE